MAQNNLPRIISGYFFKQFLSGPTLGLVVQLLIHIQRFVAPCTPGSSVLLCLPECAQTRVHRVSDAIQPSHPLLPPSPPALNLSYSQGLFQRVISVHQVAKRLELQYQSF